MDRSKYLEIRGQLRFTHEPFALARHFTIDSLLIAGAIGLSQMGFWWQLAAAPLVALLIFRSFSLMHEAVHGSVSKNRVLNDCVGVYAGALCLLPYEPWKKSHLLHHFWSGNIEKDPVMAIERLWPTLSPRAQSLLSLAWKSWFPLIAILQYGVFWMLSARQILKESHFGSMHISLVAPIAFWGTLIFNLSTRTNMMMLLPALALYFVAVEIVNIPHHAQLAKFTGDKKFPIWEQHQTARSCLYPKAFARWAVLNFNYHTEHHMFPDVPWYHLDQLHRILKEKLGPEYNTDPHMGWILENKRHSLAHVIKPAQASDDHESATKAA